MIYILSILWKYLASGNTFIDLQYTFRLGISTIRKIVKEPCFQIWNIFKYYFLSKPDKDMWKSIADKFQKNSQFPHSLDAVDGKYILSSKVSK